MGKATDWQQKRAQATREWQEEVVSLLRLPIRLGRLPRLDELSDVELGTTPTRYTAAGEDAYLPRQVVDELLCRDLACNEPPFPFVVLQGDSKAGKSRTMIEAARQKWPHAQVIVPRDGQAVAELVRLDPPLSLETLPALVWLDDVSGADLDTLTAAVLDALLGRALVIATMTTTRYQDAVRTGSEVGATARAALQRATVRILPFELSADERADGQVLYPDEQLNPGEEDRPVSIGEVLVGGEELVGRLYAGREDCPAGQAIAHAAIDARRGGLNRPIRETELQHLFPLYLRQVNAGIAPTIDQFAIGLGWASAPVSSQVAILRQTAACQWEILDYIVETQSGGHNHTSRPVPGFFWKELLAVTTPANALSIGRSAYRAGRITEAIDGMRKAQQHLPSAPLAMDNLGRLLRETGDRVGAKVTFRQAIDFCHPDYAPLAAGSLGALLAEEGDFSGAREAYQQAIDSGHRIAAPVAAASLGEVLKRTGDVAGAKAAYQQAVDSGDLISLPMASLGLGSLLAGEGDLAGAKLMFQQAIGSGHPHYAPVAAANLGAALAKDGDVAGAKVAYQLAVDSGHSACAPLAATNLGTLLAEEGDVAGAKRMFRQAIASGQSNQTPKAAVSLGTLLAEEGDVAEAKRMFQQAIDSGHPIQASQAAGQLGNLLVEEGDVAGAMLMFQQIIDSGHPDYARLAAGSLGMLLLRDAADPVRAEVMLQQASGSDDPTVAPAAALGLGMLLAKRGDLDGARTALRQAVDSGYPDLAPLASARLGILLGDKGDLDGARNALQQAIDSGHTIAAPIAEQAFKDILDR
jgi:tetratricopeptide (TPR) repeat protein